MSQRRPNTDIDGRIDRRKVLKRGSVLGLGAAALGGFGGGALAVASARQEEGARGGTLNVAVIGEPPTLDIHHSGATIVSFVMWNVYESLFTFDDEYAITPMLAELQKESDFQVRYRIWGQLQQAFYDEAALIKVGDRLDINARSGRVRGFTTQTQLGSMFWNMWLEQ